MMTAVLFLGLANSLFLLPAILSFIGPRSYIEIAHDHHKLGYRWAETIRGSSFGRRLVTNGKSVVEDLPKSEAERQLPRGVDVPL